jgi:hypothetical protein
VSHERKCVWEAKRNSVGANQTACRSFTDRVRRQMEQVLSPVGTGAEVSGTSAVACRNQSCRLPDRVQTVSALARRVPDPLLSRVGTDAVVC